ncbi:MAG: glycosyltransferase, partial [Gammaproteobacteria bacterium]|nr:glycosyltransferase [Gammaproteobacteria bacterium]
ERGRRVLYQPAAKVIHLEGVSHGTDLSQGQKAYQVKNQSTFVAKWEPRLTGHGPNGHNPLRECDRQKRVHVLWVEACMLTPDQDSGSLRTLRLLKLLLSIGCKVTFVADNLLAEEPYGQQLRDEGIEVLHSPHVQSMGDYLREHAGRYDIVTLCRHYIAIQYIDELKQRYPDTQVWFDTIDLHYLRLRRQFDLDGATATQKMAELAYQEECSVIAQSDMTIVVSDVEQAELAREMPNARVTIISNIHEPQEAVSSFENRSGILFVGGFQHPPNVDAVEYYANDIWPAVRAAIPDVETFIVGSRMPQNLKKWGEERGLTMVGFVEDLAPYYANCRLAIAPLRYGAGVKGKVNQALSYGLPVVGSAVSVEGMGLIHKKEVMVGDSPQDFVSAIVEAYSDEALWQKLSVNGAKSLEGRFTSDVAARALHAALAPWLDDRERKTAF